MTIADCKALAATLRRDLIRPLVLFNFGEDKRIPYLRFDCEEAEDLKETVEIYEKLICNIGLKIPTSHLYKKFSVPKPEESEEVATPPKASMMPFKEDISVQVNKGKTDEELQEIKVDKELQREIDKLADKATAHSSKIFVKIFEPIKELLDTSESLEDIREKFKDEKFVDLIYKKMDVKDLDSLLQKAIFYADILGRMKENERPD